MRVLSDQPEKRPVPARRTGKQLQLVQFCLTFALLVADSHCGSQSSFAACSAQLSRVVAGVAVLQQAGSRTAASLDSLRADFAGLTEACLRLQETEPAVAVLAGTPCDSLKDQHDRAVAAGLPIAAQYLAAYYKCLYSAAESAELRIARLESQLASLRQENQALKDRAAAGGDESLKSKLAAVEKFALNVDYLQIAPPKELDYLFKKTTGTYEFHDNNPPVDKNENGASYAYPVTIPPGKYVYEGELVDGLPSGHGTIKYGVKEGYSCTYTGTFLNGMKHGAGQLQVTGDGSSAGIYQQRYSYDKKDGIFVMRTSGGNERSHVYADNERSHVSRRVAASGEQVFEEVRSDRSHGFKLTYYTKTHDQLAVQTFVEGICQSTKIYKPDKSGL